eukprot:GHVO01041735.1.p1 GENE.GHVO01041735.1~~GHVO01041735.1.p1  ORF type:complete len:132 (-),score=6.16 GHVO01041735.1:163-558(-)
MFLLTKVPKAYLVVENYSEKIPMDLKKDIMEELKNTTDELQIDTSGYSHRTFGVLIYETMIDGKSILNADLVLGEEIKRLDDGEEVYALTYEKRAQLSMTSKSKETLQEELIEAIELLVYDFKEQYKEDNE